MGSLHLCLASFSCCTRTPNSHPQPTLSKVDFLNLSQSLVIMLAMLNFFILFVQRYIIIICSHPRPLQHTSPQYVGLDVHLTNMPQLQTRSSTLTKKLCSCAAPFVFSCQVPCQASFRPLPPGLQICLRRCLVLWQDTKLQKLHQRFLKEALQARHAEKDALCGVCAHPF